MSLCQIEPKIQQGEKLLIIVDDMMTNTWVPYMQELFTRKSRHEKIGGKYCTTTTNTFLVHQIKLYFIVILLLQTMIKGRSSSQFSNAKEIQDTCMDTCNYLCKYLYIKSLISQKKYIIFF